MNWTEWLETNAISGERDLARFRRSRAIRLTTPHLAHPLRALNGGVVNDLIVLLLGSGPDVVRAEAQPFFDLLPAAMAVLHEWEQHSTFHSTVMSLCETANVAECVGALADPAVLAAARRFLVTLHVSRRDAYVFDYWNRGLVALVLRDRVTWQQSAGLLDDQPPGFTPQAVFGFNLQALTRHLAGAIEARAPLEAVHPAWLDFLRHAPSMLGANQIDTATLLWVARLVFHEIAGEPLASVGGILNQNVGAFAEAERRASAAQATGEESAEDDRRPGEPRFLR